MKEIEILYSLNDDIETAENKIHNFIFEGGGTFAFVGEKRIVDTYYKSEKFDNLNPDENNRLRSSFRIREKGEVCQITHKQDVFTENDNWLYSNELEASVSDSHMLKMILAELHFRELTRVDNTKRIYESSHYELVLERVENLGNFIEIEYKSNHEIKDDEVAGIKQAIRNLVKMLKINIGEELNAGKPELMLKKIRGGI